MSWDEDDDWTCPQCGRTEHHPMDALEHYCRTCEDWTEPRTLMGLDVGTHYYARDGQPITMRRWCELMEDIAYRHVAATAITDTIHVSTVWLGLDHGFGLHGGEPIIFETMCFGAQDPGDEDCERYSTLEDALAGHERWVAAARARADDRAHNGG